MLSHLAGDAMKALATRIAELEARAAAEQPKGGPTPEAIERLRCSLASLRLQGEYESRVQASMTVEQALASIDREIAYDEEQVTFHEKAGRVDLVRVQRLRLPFLRSKRAELQARLNEMRRDETATGEPARDERGT